MTIEDIESKCEEYKVSILPIRARHLDYIERLPAIHNDPFDRLIISQAITEGPSLVTKDDKIAKYDVITIW